MVKTEYHPLHFPPTTVQDNPCCEEPGYRLRMIHAIPTLLVLDLHVITPDERREAAQQLGRNATTGTIAFWRRSLPWDMQASRVQEWSPLERELKAVGHPSSAGMCHPLFSTDVFG